MSSAQHHSALLSIMDDDEGGGFEARYDQLLKEKMEEWKRVITRYDYGVLFGLMACADE
jgi:hypothetical protein